ncbi:MAG: hypothetical protein HY606_10795 [Planctomycetes bacterium]|nr:hypothetical protein [Planctomycetota bacterium]
MKYIISTQMKRILIALVSLYLFFLGQLFVHHHFIESTEPTITECDPCPDSSPSDHHHKHDCYHQSCQNGYFLVICDTAVNFTLFKSAIQIFQTEENFILTQYKTIYNIRAPPVI